VLRGPQGVLFGRNVTAGAVLLNTAAHSNPHPRGISVESGPNYIADASIMGGLIDDVLAAKLAVFVNKDTGYFTNKYDNSKFGKQEEVIVRPGLPAAPCGQHRNRAARRTRPHLWRRQRRGGAEPRALQPRQLRFLRPEKGYNHANWNSVTAETNVNVGFGNGKITNVTGWRQFQKTKLDVDGTPNKAFIATPFTKQDQFSSELRYAGSFGPAALTVGAFYFQQHIFHIEQRDLGANTIAGGGDYHHHQWALSAIPTSS
jgi:iron complex outermembrane receptor protein